jgi:hypothetical protein
MPGLSIIEIANQGRYSGHCASFYPVARHCSLLANFVACSPMKPTICTEHFAGLTTPCLDEARRGHVEPTSWFVAWGNLH